MSEHLTLHREKSVLTILFSSGNEHYISGDNMDVVSVMSPVLWFLWDLDLPPSPVSLAVRSQEIQFLATACSLGEAEQAATMAADCDRLRYQRRHQSRQNTVVKGRGSIFFFLSTKSVSQYLPNLTQNTKVWKEMNYRHLISFT